MTRWTFCPECAAHLRLTAAGEPTCPDGHFTKYDNPVPSTIAVIVRDDRYLLVRRAHEPERGRWDAVGGFLQGNEGASDCVTREGREELGLTVTPRRLLGVYPSTYGGTGIHTIGIAYECELSEGDIRLSPENSEFRWFTAADIPDLAFPDVAAAYADHVDRDRT